MIPWLLLLLVIPAAIAQSATKGTHQPVIVIDPGHGGRDVGAGGISGTTEKALALTIGRKLAAELGKHFRVVLTRRDDYKLAASDRTAVANHHQAEIFISIHSGASFSRQPTGSKVYFHRPNAHTAMNRASTLPKNRNTDTPPIRWRNAQLTHQKSSEQLAHRICRRLRGQNPETDCQVYGLPMLTLEGAAMPAILIELGYLTNPSDEKKLQSALYQNTLVKAISIAVRRFLAADTSR